MGFWIAPLLSLTAGLGLTPRAQAEYDAISRATFWVVEIDVARCVLTYGSAPCTGTALARPCFYSRHTCHDPAHIDIGETTYRFSSNFAKPNLVPALYASWPQLWPLVVKVSPVGQKLETTGGFTLPDKLTITLDDLGSDNRSPNDPSDHVLQGDVPVLDLDKSVRNSTRGGQFWRRFVAIWPNYRGFAIRIRRGFLTSTFDQYDLHTRWQGKLSNIAFENNGQVSIACSSRFAEDQAGLEKEIPRAASGANIVTASVSRSATSCTVVNGSVLTDPDAVDFRVFFRAVGKTEIMECTDITSNTLTLSRNLFGTLGEPLRKGDVLQEIIPYVAANGVDGLSWASIVVDLLYRGGLSSSDVDSAQIAREGAILAGARLKRIITEPKAVKSMINELCDLTMASLFVDEALRVRASIPRPPYPGEGT